MKKQDTTQPEEQDGFKADRWSKLYVSAEADQEGFDESEPSSNLARIFVVLLLIHVFLIGAIILYNFIAERPRTAIAEAAPKKPTVEKISTASKAPAKLADKPAEKPAARPAPKTQGSDVYTVRDGDTLPKIAETLGVDADELASLNQIDGNTMLSLGVELIVPVKAVPKAIARVEEPAKPAAPSKPAPAAKPETPKADPTKAEPAKQVAQTSQPANAAKPAEQKKATELQKSDAPPGPQSAKSAATTMAVHDAPPKPEKDMDKGAEGLPPETKPKAKPPVVAETSKPAEKPKAEPVKPKPAAAAKATGKGRTYTVAAKDTFYSLSRKFGVSVDELMKVNNIKNAGLLREGATLKIPAKKD